MATTTGWAPTITINQDKPKRSPYVAALAEALVKPSEMKAGDHWLKGAANAASIATGTYLQIDEKNAENKRREALATALESGDKAAVQSALADLDPAKATDSFLTDQRETTRYAREDERQAQRWEHEDTRQDAQWAREDARFATTNARADAQALQQHQWRMEEAAHAANLKTGSADWSVEKDSNDNTFLFNKRTGERRVDNGDGTTTTLPATEATPAPQAAAPPPPTPTDAPSLAAAAGMPSGGQPADPAAAGAQAQPAAPIAAEPAEPGAKPVPVGKQGRAAAQKKLEPTLSGLDQLRAIKAMPYKDVLTNQGRFKAWLGDQLSSWDATESNVGKALNAGFDVTEMNKQSQDLKLRVEGMFNQYRKEITGAAAAQKELEDLRKAFLNTDMSPQTFERAIISVEQNMARAYAINQQLAAKGVLPGSDRYAKMFDRVWATTGAAPAEGADAGGVTGVTGDDPAGAAASASAPAADPLNEARQAIAQGASREKVIERLRENGIDPTGL